MERTVNYPQLLEKLAAENVSDKQLPDDRRKIVKFAKEKFTIWLNQYADMVAQMVEKYEISKITADEKKDIADNIFNQTTVLFPDDKRPKADVNKIAQDIVDNWYRCLVWGADSSAGRKARRKIWLELTAGKFTTPGTASMLREAMIAINQAYR